MTKIEVKLHSFICQCVLLVELGDIPVLLVICDTGFDTACFFLIPPYCLGTMASLWVCFIPYLEGNQTCDNVCRQVLM